MCKYGKQHDLATCLHGAIQNRRRETAVAVQLVLNQRLSLQRINVAQKFRDVTNAFPSVSFEFSRNSLEHKFLDEPFPKQMLFQHMEEHVCFLDAQDREVVAQVGFGVPQGGPYSSRVGCDYQNNHIID